MATDHSKMTTQTAEPPSDGPAWLLLVHMSADAPNLEEPQRFDFEELSRPLCEIGEDHAKRITIIVQVDTATGVSKRFLLTHKEPTFIDIFPTVPKSLKAFLDEVLGTPAPEDAGGQRRQKRLKRVVLNDSEGSWDHYLYKALVVWGHAAGVGHSLEAPSGQLTRSATGNIEEFNGESLDVVGFDACFMASVELAYEIRTRVKFMLAPEAGISLKGWHYDQLVDQVLADPWIAPDELCKKIIEQVGLSFSSPETLSLLRLRDLDALKGRISALREALFTAYTDEDREPQMRQWILDAFCEAIWVGARQFLDLGDLCRVLSSRIPKSAVRSAALGVLHVLSADPFSPTPPTKFVPAQPKGSAPTAQYTPTPGLVADQLSILEVPLSGISIYCPWPRATQCEVRAGTRNVSVDEEEYGKLQFVGETGWGSLMFHRAAVLDAERRWIVRETAQEANSVAEEIAGRADGAKPAGRADGAKPAGRADGAKPANRSSGSARRRPSEEY